MVQYGKTIMKKHTNVRIKRTINNLYIFIVFLCIPLAPLMWTMKQAQAQTPTVPTAQKAPVVAKKPKN
jgi:hypothetical protein